MIKNPLANSEDSRDEGSIPVLGRSPGVDGISLQYSCLYNPMDRRACERRDKLKKNLLNKTKYTHTHTHTHNPELEDLEHFLLFILQSKRKHVLERIARMCEWAIN